MAALIDITSQLRNVYEEIMWLRRRPNVTSSAARAWYTHVCAGRLKKYIRRFSGKVSQKSLVNGVDLRLEHHLRIQKTLTQLVERHHNENISDASNFVSTVMRCEEVHIVTKEENYAAMRSKGDYTLAGIDLLDWHDLDVLVQRRLWSRKIKGQVSNQEDYLPRNLA